MDNIRLDIGKEFNPQLGGRFIKAGEFSGEAFYSLLEKKYSEAKEKNVKLIVELDNATPYASSFLDQSFGALYRTYKEDVISRLIIESNLYNWIVDYIKQRIWVKSKWEK